MKRMLAFMTIFTFLPLMAVFSAGQQEAVEEKVEIEFFLQKPEIQGIVEEMVDMFERENSSIEVEVNAVPDSKQVLLVRMANNNMPDVFSTWPNEVEYKLQVDEGYMMDLSETDAIRRVQPSVAETLHYKGGDYAIPISVNTMGVYYNPAIFDELGLSIPNTYEELIDVLRTVKNDGQYIPMVFSDKEPWAIGYQVVLMAGSDLSSPYTFFDEVASGKIKASDNPDFRRVAEKTLELREYGQDDYLGTGYGQAISDFATGKAATFIQGIWAIPSIRDANPDLEFSMFPLPSTTKEETKTIYGVDFALAVSASTPHKEAAVKFVDFLTSVEMAQLYAEKDGSPSVITGVETKNEEIVRLVELLNTGKSFEWLNFHWEPGVFDNHHKLAQKLVATKDPDKYLAEVTELFYKK